MRWPAGVLEGGHLSDVPLLPKVLVGQEERSDGEVGQNLCLVQCHLYLAVQSLLRWPVLVTDNL